MRSTEETTKAAAAEAILDRCVGRHGVWAGDRRYRSQCWTRDFAFATAPMLQEMGENRIVRGHLAELSRRVRPNGRVPIVYLDGLRGHARFLFDKTRRSLRDRKLSFMLRRYLQGKLWNLTPGTTDSEILYLVAMGEEGRVDPGFADDHDAEITATLDYVRQWLMVDGLALGADWRDTMHDVLADEPLLTNNCLLYRAFVLHGCRDAAEALKQRIRSTHFVDDRVLDYPGNERFDPLGAAFAVLNGVAEPADYPALVAQFRSVDTPVGVTIKCRHNPISPEEAAMIERTDGVVVWPFVVGFTVLALLAMGETAFAEEQFAKLVAQDGFREYYDPETGTGWGENNQLWSATLYWRAHQALRGNSPS